MEPARLQTRMLVLTGVAVAILSAICLGAASAPSAGAAQHIVIIKQMHFEPPELTVNAGDTVEWKNEDIFAHTVTADNGSFDSGLIAPGSSWSTVIQGQGTIGYHCRPHPNMAAKLVVAAGQEGTNANAAAPSGEENGPTLAWVPPSAPEEFHPILVNFTAALLPLAL